MASISSKAWVSLSSSPWTEAPVDEPSPSDHAPEEAPPLPPLFPFNSFLGDSDGVLAPELTSVDN